MRRVRLPAIRRLVLLSGAVCALGLADVASPGLHASAVQYQDPNLLPPCDPYRHGGYYEQCEVIETFWVANPRGLKYGTLNGVWLDPGPDASTLWQGGKIRLTKGSVSVIWTYAYFLGYTCALPGRYDTMPAIGCGGSEPPPPPPPPPPPSSCEEEAEAKAVIAAGGKVIIRSDLVIVNGGEGGHASRIQTCSMQSPGEAPGPPQRYNYGLGPVAGYTGGGRTIDLNRRPPKDDGPSLHKELTSRLPPGVERRPPMVDMINEAGGVKNWIEKNRKKEPERYERIHRSCGCGVRGSFNLIGFSLDEGSPAFTFGGRSFPAIDDPFFSLLISWDNIGDGDWLDISFEGETLWSGVGTDFEQGQHYMILVPASLVRGRDGLLAFVLGSTGDSQASVFIGDPATMTYPDDSIIPINLPPFANAGPDLTVEAQGAFGATFALSGSASTDPEGQALSYMWESGGGIIGLTSSPSVTLPLGTHTFRLTVVDDQGNYSSDDLTVRVVDTTPPDITLAAPSVSTLWPANHRMVPVTVAVTAQDLVDPAPVCKVMWVTSNEPASANGAGPAGTDFELTGPLSMALRASRSGRGTGRIYTAGVECADFSGNRATRTVAVTVPHDQGRR